MKSNYGVPNDGVGISQAECARRLGISRARVAQIEIQALRKLKELMLARKLNAEAVRP